MLHLIPHLGQGGAEAALAALLATPQPGVEHAVCTMIDAPSHFAVDQPVFRGPGRRGRPSPALALHLRRAVRAFRPHVLHCWMYHANLLSLASVGSGARILWSIHSERPCALGQRMTRWVSAACARFSSVAPHRIVYVADTARSHHEAAGYHPSRSVVIPNGIDTARFRLPSTPRPRDDVLRLGLIARYDPDVKGHHFLIDRIAAHPLRDRVRLTFAGQGCDDAAPLREHLAATGLLERAHVHGAVPDVERLYEELDILVLPSRSEALPMTLLEGAATGLVVCASRVGDITRLGLPEEALFEPDDAAGFARALDAAADLARRPAAAERQRSLIEPRFGIGTIASRYADLYRETAS